MAGQRLPVLILTTSPFHPPWLLPAAEATNYRYPKTYMSPASYPLHSLVQIPSLYVSFSSSWAPKLSPFPFCPAIDFCLLY